ncbi:MAG: histidine phosphatase family protein [Clostridiales bacterium]|nr:histidine phosphatase family protein [Clostridiales bacterium]
MELYLIRHGETDYNKTRRLQGHLDIELNDNGRNQAIAVSDEISTMNIDLIISSPQKRALETAQIIARKTNSEIRIDENLMERAFGSLEGMAFKDILNQHPKFFDMIRMESEMPIEGIETVKAVEERVQSVLERIKEESNIKKILLVSHGGTARVFHKVINSDKEYFNIQINNCQIEKFEI